jgi:hypothetical protein
MGELHLLCYDLLVLRELFNAGWPVCDVIALAIHLDLLWLQMPRVEQMILLLYVSAYLTLLFKWN